MIELLVSWVVLALAVWITSLLVDGFVVHKSIDVLVVSAVFGLLNALASWLLARGVGTLSLGSGVALRLLTTWLVTSALLWLTSLLTKRLELKGLKPILTAGLVVSALGTILEGLATGLLR